MGVRVKKLEVEKTTADKREINVVFSYIAFHFIVDGYGYFNGKDSITGRMAEWISSGQILKDVFMTIAEILRSISKFFFGAKTTKKIFDFMEGKDENGVKKAGGGWSVGQALQDLGNTSMMGIPGINLTQDNTANFLARNAQKDGEAAGEFAKKSAVEDATMQRHELARVTP